MKRILFALFIIINAHVAMGQAGCPVTPLGNAAGRNTLRGTTVTDSGMVVPDGFHKPQVCLDSVRMIWYESAYKTLFVHTGLSRVMLINKTYFDSVIATISGGGPSTVASVNGQTGTVVLTTTHISEGTNLYFTNVRADARVAAALINYYTKGQIDSTLALFQTLASAQATYVPLTRTITINGTAFDLTANRSWSVQLHNKWGMIIYGYDSVAQDTGLVTTRLRAKKIGDSVAALIPTNNNQLTNGAGYITLSSVSATGPLVYDVMTGTFSMPAASTSVSGYLSNTDWQVFNAKQAALNGTGLVRMTGTTVSYDNTTYYPYSNPNSWIGLGAISATAPVAYNNSTGVISMAQSSGSVAGYLSATDWNTFNNKQPGGTYIQYLLNDFGMTITGTTSVTVTIDTGLVATRVRVQKAVDSLNAIIASLLPQITTVANYTGTLTPTSTTANANSTVKYHITAQAGNLVFNPPTGSWADGQPLIVRITNNGSAYTLTFSTATGGYRFSTAPGAPAQPAGMTASKSDYYQFAYNALANKFDFVGYGPGY